MGLKDLFLAGVALKALKKSDRPGVVATTGYTVVAMRHSGFGSDWEISYVEDSNPSNIKSFRVNRSHSGMSVGRAQFKVLWN